MSLQRQFDRSRFHKTGKKWPKSAQLDARNEGFAKVGFTLHPTKGFRTRAAWRDDAARRAAKGAQGDGLIRRLLNLLAA